MTDAERAREIAINNHMPCDDRCEGPDGSCGCKDSTGELVKDILAALAAARAEERERCAKVVENDVVPESCTSHCAGGCLKCSPGTVLDLAADAIRAGGAA